MTRLVFFLATAHDAPALRPGWPIRCALRQPMAWVLSLFYFDLRRVRGDEHLPADLPDPISNSPTDAGMRTAGFVFGATLMGGNPLGSAGAAGPPGSLPGRSGLLLTLPMLPFTLGLGPPGWATAPSSSWSWNTSPRWARHRAGGPPEPGFFPPLVGALHQPWALHGFVFLALFGTLLRRPGG